MPATRRRRFILLAVLALMAFVAGAASGRQDKPGPLRWAGAPRSGAAGEGAVLYGTLVNRAKTPVRVRLSEIHAVGGDGKRLETVASFSGGYVMGSAQVAVPPVVLRPGGRLPLSVAWTGDAARIEVGDSRLPVPQ